MYKLHNLVWSAICPVRCKLESKPLGLNRRDLKFKIHQMRKQDEPQISHEYIDHSPRNIKNTLPFRVLFTITHLRVVAAPPASQLFLTVNITSSRILYFRSFISAVMLRGLGNVIYACMQCGPITFIMQSNTRDRMEMMQARTGCISVYRGKHMCGSKKNKSQVLLFLLELRDFPPSRRKKTILFNANAYCVALAIKKPVGTTRKRAHYAFPAGRALPVFCAPCTIYIIPQIKTYHT